MIPAAATLLGVFLFLTASDAFAQVAVGSEKKESAEAAADSPAVDWLFPSGELIRSRITIGAVDLIGTMQQQVAMTTSSFGPTWRVKGGISFAPVDGLQFTASASVRRGYSLPITQVQLLGSDVLLPDTHNSALEYGWSPTRLDTELRVEWRQLTKPNSDLTAVGEVFNPFGTPKPATLTPFTMGPQRAIRGGFLFGFR